MDNFLYDMFLAIFSAVLGAVLGLVIPKLFKSDKDNNTINTDKQLVFAQIHIEQNQYLYNSSLPKEKVSCKSKDKSDISAGEIVVALLIGSFFLIYGCLKYEQQIIYGCLFITVLLESVFLTMSHNVSKNIHLDTCLRSIFLFNVFSTCCIPILLYIIRYPFAGGFVDKKDILTMLIEKGVFSLLFDANTYGFLLYQALGIIFLFGFILYIFIGTIHIFAMINLALDNRNKNIYRFLYKKTRAFCKFASVYIGIGVMLLLISFLFVSGIFFEFIN